MLYLLIGLLVFILVGLIINRVLLIKYFICYEIVLFTISIILINYSHCINELVLVLYIIWNSIFELIFGLNSLFI